MCVSVCAPRPVYSAFCHSSSHDAHAQVVTVKIHESALTGFRRLMQWKTGLGVCFSVYLFVPLFICRLYPTHTLT